MILQVIKKLLKNGFFFAAWALAMTRLSEEEKSDGPDWLRALVNADEDSILDAAEISRGMAIAEEWEIPERKTFSRN